MHKAESVSRLMQRTTEHLVIYDTLFNIGPIFPEVVMLFEHDRPMCIIMQYEERARGSDGSASDL